MSARDAVIRAAIVKFLTDRLAETRKGVDVAVLEHLDRGDRKHARLEDETDIATVSVSDPKGTPRVTAEAEFLAWVEDNYPAAVITTKQVTPAWQKSFLETLDVVESDVLVDVKTGEVVPGVEHRTGSPSVTVRQSAAQKDALVEAFHDGRLADMVRDVLTERLPLES